MPPACSRDKLLAVLNYFVQVVLNTLLEQEVWCKCLYIQPTLEEFENGSEVSQWQT